MSKTMLVALLVIGMLVGFVLGQMSRPQVCAQTSMGAGRIVVATGNIDSQNRDLLYVIDTQDKVLCVYDMQGYQLKLLAARNISYDLSAQEFSAGNKQQQPSVRRMRDFVKKRRPRR